MAEAVKEQWSVISGQWPILGTSDDDLTHRPLITEH
jgi:hypothetical protein